MHGRLGSTFKVRKHLVWSGGGQSGQTYPNFIRGDPVGSIRKEKNTNQNRWQVRHVTGNFLVIFLLGHLSLGEIWGWEKKKRLKVPNVLRMVGGSVFTHTPRCSLSLQTPAPDRVNGVCFSRIFAENPPGFRLDFYKNEPGWRIGHSVFGQF